MYEDILIDNILDELELSVQEGGYSNREPLIILQGGSVVHLSQKTRKLAPERKFGP